MKAIAYICALLLFLVLSFSCSNDFLSENQKSSYKLTDTLFLNNNQDQVETSIFFPAKNNSDYTIFMQPKWLSFNTMHGKVVNGIIPLSFDILKGKINSDNHTIYGDVVIDINDAGLLSLTIEYSDFGTPIIQCSTTTLNFNTSNTLTFKISNISDGILIWNISGLPDWLDVSSSSGVLGIGNSISISASLILDKIPAGQALTGTLQISSNTQGSPTIITIYAPATLIVPPVDYSKITGIVTDAEFSKNTGIITICTKSPNSLILFNTVTNTFKTIDLSMSPNCISISEDGHKAVIGYSVAFVSYIDLDNSLIIKDYPVTCIPFDIVLGDNVWCYIAPATGQNINMVNLNIETGQVISNNNRSRMYEKTIIKKVPGQPFMMGSCTALSPSGIETFDISKGMANDTIGHYHVDGGNLWISGDGSKLYTQGKKVYLFPKHDILYHFNMPSIYGEIETSLSYLSSFSECQSTNSFFISYYSTFNSSENPGIIQQFNTTNLNQIKSFTVSPVYLIEGGISTKFLTDARYVFVNNTGSELYVLKNLKVKYNRDYWTIEKFQVTSK